MILNKLRFNYNKNLIKNNIIKAQILSNSISNLSNNISSLPIKNINTPNNSLVREKKISKNKLQDIKLKARIIKPVNKEIIQNKDIENLNPEVNYSKSNKSTNVDTSFLAQKYSLMIEEKHIQPIKSNSISISSEVKTETLKNQGVALNFPKSQTIDYQMNINGAAGMHGQIEWKFDGEHYNIKFFTKIILLGEILQESSGIVNEFGLQPLIYKNFKFKKHYVTNFDYDKNLISFSKNSSIVNMPIHVKDFASVAFQLIAVLRANPPIVNSKYEFSIATDDDIQIWNINCTNLEKLEINHEKIIQAWHCERLPRFNGDNRKIEWWLQPSNEWLIAKFKQTEPNGIELEFIQK